MKFILILLLIVGYLLFSYSFKITGNGEFNNDVTLKLMPSNTEIINMLKTNGWNDSKFKVCSLSLFRPKKRNTRYAEYYNGLIKYADNFYKIFPKSEGWILRLYIDDSLFTTDYEYDDRSLNREKNQWDGQLENAKWYELINTLKSRDVQIAKYRCKQFALDATYHKGYFGTIARFFSLFDDDVSATIFRDADAAVILPDKLHIDDWIKSDNKAHAYQANYTPDHVKCLRGNEWYVNLTPMIGAGLWASKHVNKKELWPKIVDCLNGSKVEECTPNFSYGVDEVVLNGAIIPYLNPRYDKIFGFPDTPLPNDVGTELVKSYNEIDPEINAKTYKIDALMDFSGLCGLGLYIYISNNFETMKKLAIGIENSTINDDPKTFISWYHLLGKYDTPTDLKIKEIKAIFDPTMNALKKYCDNKIASHEEVANFIQSQKMFDIIDKLIGKENLTVGEKDSKKINSIYEDLNEISNIINGKSEDLEVVMTDLELLDMLLKHLFKIIAKR